MKWLLCLCVLFWFGLAKGQEDSLSTLSDEDDEIHWVKPGPEGKFHAGIKMGLQPGILLGSEMKNARPSLGLLGGMYTRVNFKHHISFQLEVIGSFRGSKFINGDGEYSAIRNFYFDLPLFVLKAFGKEHASRIGFGGQVSYLLNSTMYFGKGVPAAKNLDLNRIDYGPMLVFQQQFGYFGFQTALKYGLVDLNKNIPWPDPGQPLNRGGSIHNVNLELNLIF